MRKTLKRKTRKNRTLKGGVKFSNRIKGLFTRRKNLLSQKKNNTIVVNSIPKPTLSGNNNVLITLNSTIVKRYPANQKANKLVGFYAPKFGPHPRNWAPENWQ